MACPNENRERPRTVAFRVTNEEFNRIEERVTVTGEVKGDYLRAMALEGGINIFVGKYKSDKLALEFRKMRRSMEEALANVDLNYYSETIDSIRILLEELKSVVETNEIEEEFVHR